MKLAMTIFAILIGVGAMPVVVGAEEAEPDQSWQRYEILVERNAFSQTRGRRRVERPVRVRPPRPVESFVVLLGIYEQEDGIVAFLEDIRGGSQKVRVGDTIAGGKVTAITIDNLVFEKDGATRTVEVGGRLGLAPDTSASYDDTAAAPGESPPETTTTSGGAADSILERLRQRRAQELSK